MTQPEGAPPPTVEVATEKVSGVIELTDLADRLAGMSPPEAEGAEPKGAAFAAPAPDEVSDRRERIRQLASQLADELRALADTEGGR